METLDKHSERKAGTNMPTLHRHNLAAELSSCTEPALETLITAQNKYNALENALLTILSINKFTFCNVPIVVCAQQNVTS